MTKRQNTITKGGKAIFALPPFPLSKPKKEKDSDSYVWRGGLLLKRGLHPSWTPRSGKGLCREGESQWGKERVNSI